MKVGYFGTSLTNPGHYFWEMTEYSLHPLKYRFEDYPFNPEALPYDNGVLRKNGQVKYYDFAGFKIIAIVGSCKDERPGSKSVFFTTKKEITLGEFRDFLKNHPTSKKMFEQMKFEINW